MKSILCIPFILAFLMAQAQSIDSTTVKYKDDTLSVYVAGQLFKPSFPNGGGINNTHRAITSVSYQTSNDTLFMSLYFHPCGVTQIILTYDTLIEKEIILPQGQKQLVLYSIDTVIPNCPYSIDTVSIVSLTFGENLSNNLSLYLNEVTLYPNPSTGSFVIGGVSDNQLLGISLINLNGNLLKSFSPTENLDLSFLPKGMYLVDIKTSSGRVIEKLILK